MDLSAQDVIQDEEELKEKLAIMFVGKIILSVR
jgi:hypothetical protein